MTKAIVDIDLFRKYNNYYEEDTDELCDYFLRASENIVQDYLGYDPNRTEYIEYIQGVGSNKLYTRVRPISDFSYVIRVDTQEMIEGLTYNSDYIYTLDGSSVFQSGVEYEVHYEGGYRNVPEDIKLAVIRIASLQLAESQGNIGISGKSNMDQSRTFISYNNYDKYLRPLIGYRSKGIC